MTRMVTPDELRAMQALEMPERELQEQVRQIALAHGWFFYHPWRSDHSAAGYPDCHCLRGNRQLVIECKREGRKPTPEQRGWLQAFEEAGSEVYIIHPSDLIAGTVHAILRGE